MNPRVCVFSGGSGWNPYVQLLQEITQNVAYIMPVSDDGGSTSQIVEAFGGPGIGDLRSRIIRLADIKDEETKCIHDLLSYRLSTDREEAIAELEKFLSFSHKTCQRVSDVCKLNILTFLRYFCLQLLNQNRNFHHGSIKYHNPISFPDKLLLDSKTGLYHSELETNLSLSKPHNSHHMNSSSDISILSSFLASLPFDFRHGSIGNFYLTGAMLYFKSLDIALSQMSILLHCPTTTSVLPVVSSEFVMGKPRRPLCRRRCRSMIGRHHKDFAPHLELGGSSRTLTLMRTGLDQSVRLLDQRSVVICALLMSGQKIIGQCAISHPGKAVGEFAPEIHRKSLSQMTPLGFERSSVLTTPHDNLKVTSSSPLTQMITAKLYSSSDSSNFHSSSSSTLERSFSNTPANLTDILISPSSSLSVSTPSNLQKPDFTFDGGKFLLNTKLTLNLSLPAPGTQLDSKTNGPQSNLFFSKTDKESLPSPIRRIFYIDQGEKEICPPLHPSAHQQLYSAEHIIYSIGSLYTSMIPCLIVPGIGQAIAQSDNLWNKILVLNGTTDRETEGYDALDFILAITDALNYSCRAQKYAEEVLQISHEENFHDKSPSSLSSSFSADELHSDKVNPHPFSQNRHFQNSLKQQNPSLSSSLCGSSIPRNIAMNGIESLSHFSPELDKEILTASPGLQRSGSNEQILQANRTSAYLFPYSERESDLSSLRTFTTCKNRTYFVSPHPPSAYITHLLYLKGCSIPVDEEQIESLGIKCIGLEGQSSTKTAAAAMATSVPITTDTNLKEPHMKLQYGTQELYHLLSSLIKEGLV